MNYLFFFSLVSDTSKHKKESKSYISSGYSSHNIYNRPKLKQTPSIVINSPRNSKAIDLSDITIEEPGRETNDGNFMPGRETEEFSYFHREPGKDSNRNEFSHFSKDLAENVQQQHKKQFIPERKAKLPCEKQRGSEHEIYKDADEREKQSLKHNGARNTNSSARIVSSGPRIASSEARKAKQSSSDKRFDSTSDEIHMPPSLFSNPIDNTEGFSRRKPAIMNQYGETLHGQSFSGYDLSAESRKNRQVTRQSQSESSLKSKSAPERPVNSILKTFSDPTDMQMGHENRVSNDPYSPETSLETKNFFSSKNTIQDRGDKLTSRFENLNKDTVPLVGNDKQSTSTDYNKNNAYDTRSPNIGHTNNTIQTDINMAQLPPADNGTKKVEANEAERSQGEVFGGLLGEADANHSAEYYDRMISKLNEQINLAVSRNKSPYAFYGLGSDDDDDWC